MLHKVLAVPASGSDSWKDTTFWMIFDPLPRKKWAEFLKVLGNMVQLEEFWRLGDVSQMVLDFFT